MKRWIIVIVLIAVAGAGWFGWRWLRAKAARAQQKPVQTAPAEVRDVQEAVEIVGEIASALDIEIKSEVSGRIIGVKVTNGDLVKEKQLLLVLDQADLLSQRAVIMLAIESAALRLEKAKGDFDRQHSLFQNKLVTDKEFKDSQIDQSLAENDLRSQRAQLQTLDQSLTKTSIYAPMDGMVVQCDARAGQVIVGASSVSQGTVLMRVVQPDRLIVKSNVNEVDAVKIAKDMKATVTFDSIPGLTLEATVDRLSPSAQTKEAADRRDNIRLFPVELSCKQSDPRVKLGISANVRIPTGDAKGVVAVPITSVFNESTNKVVFVKNGDNFDKRTVAVGLNDLQFVEIKKGVAKDDLVALSYPPDRNPAKKPDGK